MSWTIFPPRLSGRTESPETVRTGLSTITFVSKQMLNLHVTYEVFRGSIRCARAVVFTVQRKPLENEASAACARDWWNDTVSPWFCSSCSLVFFRTLLPWLYNSFPLSSRTLVDIGWCSESRCCVFGPYAHICSLTTQTAPVARTAGAGRLSTAPAVQTERTDRNRNTNTR